jgi:tryptophan-rich sensory protein
MTNDKDQRNILLMALVVGTLFLIVISSIVLYQVGMNQPRFHPSNYAFPARSYR